MENGLLPNSAITASSVYGASTHGAWLARLNNVPKGNSGAWSAASNKAGQWLHLISGRKGCWQILPHRGGLPPLNGWRHTQFCSVQTASHGRNTGKMVSWRYVMLFFSRGISHATRHVTLPVSYDLSGTARGYLFVRFIDAMFLSFIVLHNYYLE